MAPRQARKAQGMKDETKFVRQVAETTKALSACHAKSCKSEVEAVRKASNALLKLVLTLAAKKPEDWKEQADKAQHAILHGKEVAALTKCAQEQCSKEMQDIMKLFKQAMPKLCKSKSDAMKCETMKKMMPVGLGA
jgi:hypothetical protein